MERNEGEASTSPPAARVKNPRQPQGGLGAAARSSASAGMRNRPKYPTEAPSAAPIVDAPSTDEA